MKRLRTIFFLSAFVYLSFCYWEFKGSAYPFFSVSNFTFPIYKTAGFLNKKITSIKDLFSELDLWITSKNKLIQKIQKTEELENEIHNLKISLSNMQNQFQRIKEYSNFSYPIEFSKVSVPVYGYPINCYESFLVTANPSNVFIKKDYPVISTKGLVGRVVEVYPRILKILLVTDILSRIPVKFLNSKERGILIGNGSNLMNLEYLQNTPDNSAEFKKFTPQEGEVLITSGAGGIFPEGIPVGVISKTGDNIQVKPFVNVTSLNIVTILYEKNEL